MKNFIKITPLSHGEIMATLKLAKFNVLRPAKCEDCGCGADFVRSMFKINGVQKDRYRDEQIRGIISAYMRDVYKIEYVFFKSHENEFYVDSAVCPKCQSTRILFDIELTDDFLRPTARFTGKSIEEIRRDMKKISNRRARAEARKPLNRKD